MTQAAQQWGKVVVCFDDWAMSNDGFSQADGSRYASNVLDYFHPGPGGRFFARTNYEGVNQPVAFASSFRGVVVGRGAALDMADTLPADLSVYDALFLCGAEASAPALTAYVQQGGCVYIAGGSGGNDASLWNAFLSQFGIVMAPGVSPATGSLAIHSTGEPLVRPGHPLLEGVSSLLFLGGTQINLASGSPSSTVVAGTFGSQIAVVAADAGLQTDVWEDGAIRVTHRYRKNIRENLVINGGTVTVENMTTQLPLGNVKLSIDTDNANQNPNWSAWTCDSAGTYKKYKNMPLSASLAPGQSVTLPYSYTTSPTGNVVPGALNVDIHIMPQYDIHYSKDRPVGAVRAMASSTATADGPIQTAQPFTDVDGLIRISDFKYVSTVAETADTRMIGGASTTLNVAMLFRAKQMSVSIGVEPEEDSSFWDADSCDASGNDVHPPPWYPPTATLTQAQPSASFSYQYNLEANVSASQKENFAITLYALPRIHVFYTAVDSFTSTASATGT
ncbi:MAG: hypothetical protein R3F14_30990 [Polyangiaceae bacterium]